MRANESVSNRAVAGGMTSAAAICVTPPTFIEATVATVDHLAFFGFCAGCGAARTHDE